MDDNAVSVQAEPLMYSSGSVLKVSSTSCQSCQKHDLAIVSCQ